MLNVWPVHVLTGEGEVGLDGLGGIVWAADSRSIWIDTPFHMSYQIFRVSIPDGVLTRYTTDDDRNFGLIQSGAAGRSVFFTRESFLESAEIYVSRTDSFKPHAVSSINTKLSWPDIEAQRLSWPSSDGKWSIAGWLLLPKGDAHRGPRPLLLYAEGGPGMIFPHAGIGSGYPLQAFVASGMAVLIPNSRGRAGYGVDFETAWQNERDCAQGPMEDDLAGVDLLVRSGIADPERVALAGHSWGGYLAAYALTHTDRFKAVLLHEAVNLNLLANTFYRIGSADGRELSRQFGWEIPFDADSKRDLEDISPVYQAGRATTPSLLEFGAQGQIEYGTVFFQALQYFHKAPSELVSYPRTGHVTDEPELRYDAARRELEWFAYWVLGKPTERMFTRYGSPKISEWNPDTGAAVTVH